MTLLPTAGAPLHLHKFPGKIVVRDPRGLRDLDTESAGGTEMWDTQLGWRAGLRLSAPSAQPGMETLPDLAQLSRQHTIM